ncbi:MAG: putative leader peptide [Streptosporangiaceae bacterium]
MVHVKERRITEIPEACAMHRTAAHRDLMLVGRRHVDLVRVSSAICRSFC